MAILIDPPAWHAHGRAWSHLVSDTSLDELHTFARGLGIPARAFEGDHYDVPQEHYARAIAAGARPVDARTVLRSLQRSGLRLQKRLGDKGLARIPRVRLPSGTVADVDLLLSPNLFDERRVFAAQVFVRDSAGDLVTVHSVRRRQWGSPGGWREPGESVRANAVREVCEETGLFLAPQEITPWGYERFTHLEGPRLAPPGQDVLQAFVAHLDERRPPLRATMDDTSARRWVTPQEYAALCGAEFWWPLAQRLLQPPG